MLYEMLAGKTPFSGPNPFALMNDRLVNDPPALRKSDPGISAELEEIVYRALERDPAARYANAREFASARTPERPRHPRFAASVATYALMLVLPVLILTLLLLFARFK